MRFLIIRLGGLIFIFWSSIDCDGILILNHYTFLVGFTDPLFLNGYINRCPPFQYYVELIAKFTFYVYQLYEILPALIILSPESTLRCFNLLQISSNSRSFSFLSLKNCIVLRSGTKETSKSLTVLYSKGFRRISIATYEVLTTINLTSNSCSSLEFAILENISLTGALVVMIIEFASLLNNILC